MSEKKLFVVETLVSYRMTYFIEAKERVHALDEMVCNFSNPDFIEGAQYHIGEEISNSYEITKEEFFKIFDRENDYLQSWSPEKKLEMINKIDYKDE
jgi:hypothetical protein